MIAKVILVCVISLVVAKPHGPAGAKYPAGVNPQDCPGYPVCDNAQLHSGGAGHWQGAGGWAGAWQPHAWTAAAGAWDDSGAWNNDVGSVGTGGDKYPAGVSPHTCPNYPYCSVHAGAAAPPLPGWSERQYPAGVSPHTCPNFPYCH